MCTPRVLETPQSTSPYVTQLQHDLGRLHQLAREHLCTAHQHQKDYHDKSLHGTPLQIGQVVYLHNPIPPPGLPHKLHRKWTGPFVVHDILSPTTCRIRKPTEGWDKAFTVHFDRLKLSTRSEHIGSRPQETAPAVTSEVEV